MELFCRGSHNIMMSVNCDCCKLAAVLFMDLKRRLFDASADKMLPNVSYVRDWWRTNNNYAKNEIKDFDSEGSQQVLQVLRPRGPSQPV